MNVEELVKQLMLPICEETGTYLVDTQYVREFDRWYLRIFIDTDEGVTISECVTVTEIISTKLDDEDFITEEYTLEVSSPGAERPLTSACALAEAVGQHVFVQVKAAINEVSEFQGDLISFESGILTLVCLFKNRSKKIEIPYSNVYKARLAVKF